VSVETQTMPVIADNVAGHCGQSSSVSSVSRPTVAECNSCDVTHLKNVNQNTREPSRSRSFCHKIVSVSNND